MPDTPTQAELIRRAIEAHMQELHTAMPVRVISYNASRETVDLVPQFRRSVANDPQAAEPFTLEDLPTFPDVPVQWPSGGGGSHFITFPLAKEDTGLAVFCERDLGVWRSTGQPGTTGDQRTHSLAGAVFYPGLRPNGEKLGPGKVGTRVTIGTDVSVGSTGAAQDSVRGTKFKADLDAALVNGILPNHLLSAFTLLETVAVGPLATLKPGFTAGKLALTTYLATLGAHLTDKLKVP